jgi:hypothetical protein
MLKSKSETVTPTNVILTFQISMLVDYQQTLAEQVTFYSHKPTFIYSSSTSMEEHQWR